MGKKKSVVLLTLITIVILVFCAVSALPSFSLSVFDKDTVKKWFPAAAQYDLDADLGGGYYALYYPEGVISEIEYNTIKEEKAAESTEAENEYVDSYVVHKGLYLSKEEEYGIVALNESTGEYEVTEAFKESFAETAKMIAARYEARGYSSYRVSVVDDYALKTEIPSSDTNAGTIFQYFAYTGEFNVTDGTNTLFPENDEAAKDYFKSFKTKTSGDSVYVEIKTTSAGSEKMKEMTSDEDVSTLNFCVGENVVLAPTASYLTEQSTNVWVLGMTDKDAAEAVCILLNSAISYGDTGVTFEAVSNSSVGAHDAIYGADARNRLYVAIAIAVLALLVLPVVRYGGFGVATAYSSLTYFGVTAFCFAFITEGVFEVSAGTAIVFLLGLVMTVFLSVRVYGYIKKEFDSGKTVVSSVKAGYKKTLLSTVDVCVLLFLGAFALLFGAGGLHTLAIQALICFATTAFCSLLWTRVINSLLMSAHKNKYKYFRFVREDDDDE